MCGNHLSNLNWGCRLVLNGKKVLMRQDPWLSEDHDRIVLVEGEIDMIVYKDFEKHRGNIWEVKNDKLYLIAADRPFRTIGREPIHADWYSGILAIPRGECLVENEHLLLGIYADRETTTLVDIKDGMVTSTRVVNTLEYQDKEYSKWLHSRLSWKIWNALSTFFCKAKCFFLP